MTREALQRFIGQTVAITHDVPGGWACDRLRVMELNDETVAGESGGTWLRISLPKVVHVSVTGLDTRQKYG